MHALPGALPGAIPLLGARASRPRRGATSGGIGLVKKRLGSKHHLRLFHHKDHEVFVIFVS